MDASSRGGTHPALHQRQVRQLEELLPICSYCKKIRDDQNYWQQMEGYISERTGSDFSHFGVPRLLPARRVLPEIRKNQSLGHRARHQAARMSVERKPLSTSKKRSPISKRHVTEQDKAMLELGWTISPGACGAG